jgi:asparagine synthetase B (glutamine-hydrolysing)
MCGICGIYGIEDNAPIQRMLSVLRHRGPDDKGIYLDGVFHPGRHCG